MAAMRRDLEAAAGNADAGKAAGRCGVAGTDGRAGRGQDGVAPKGQYTPAGF